MAPLAGTTSFLVGNAFQAQMPQFSADIRGAGTARVRGAPHGDRGGLGARRAPARVVELSAPTRGAARDPHGHRLGASILALTLTTSYIVAVLALFAADLLALGYGALAQRLVQLEAPEDRRGRVVDLFSMSQNGLRVGSGVTIGDFGAALGAMPGLLGATPDRGQRRSSSSRGTPGLLGPRLTRFRLVARLVSERALGLTGLRPREATPVATRRR